MRCLAICMLILLSGCARLDLSDLSTTAGATTGAVVASVVTANPAVIATSTIAGGVAGGALVEDTTDANDACIENPEACASIQTGQTIRDFVHWIIGGSVVLIIAAWLIPGPQLVWRRRKEKE